MRPLGIEHHGVDGAGVDQRIRLGFLNKKLFLFGTPL